MSVTRKTVVITSMAAAAATIGLAGPANADDTQHANFLSPSGNINCSIMLEPPFVANGVNYSGNNDVQCEIVDHAWQPPEGCPASVDVVGASMGADATAPPVVVCVKYPNQLPLPGRRSTMAKPQTLGAISCDSELSGITCTNANTGHFFRLSSESYDVG